MPKITSVALDSTGKRNEYIKAIESVSSDFEMSLDGKYASGILEKNATLRARTQLRADVEGYIYEQTCKAFMAESKLNHSSPKLLKMIHDTRGRELPGFTSFQTFEAYVRYLVSEWKPHLFCALNKTAEIVHRVGDGLIDHHAASYPELAKKLKKILTNIIECRLEKALSEEVPRLLDEESRPMTCATSFIKRLNELKMQNFESSLPQSNQCGWQQGEKTYTITQLKTWFSENMLVEPFSAQKVRRFYSI
jgi:hypothetical protein